MKLVLVYSPPTMRYALPRAVTATEVENVSHRASYILWHDGVMAHTITFRPDEDARRALSILTEDGTPVSVAVRRALIDAAHTRAHQRLRAEAKALAADEKDRAEVAQVLRDMETLRAW